MAYRLSVGLRQHRVDDLADQLLLGLGQSAEWFELLLRSGRRPALAGTARGRGADEFLDGDAEGVGQRRQHRDGHAALAALVGGDGLLADVEPFRQLDLGQALGLAQRRQAFAEGDKEGAFLVADGHAGRRVVMTHRFLLRSFG